MCEYLCHAHYLPLKSSCAPPYTPFQFHDLYLLSLTHMLFYVHVLGLISWCGMTNLKPHL